MKHIRSEYKNVSGVIIDIGTFYIIELPKVTRVWYKTEREAAIAVDKYLISKGKNPVNILKRKA